MKSIEQKLQEALVENENLKKQIATATTKLNEAHIAKAKAERDVKLSEAKLPAPSVGRITEAFKASTDNAGLQEAINTEKKYLEDLGITPKIERNNGPGAPVSEAEQQTAKLKESQYYMLVKSGTKPEEAEAMTGFHPKK